MSIFFSFFFSQILYRQIYLKPTEKSAISMTYVPIPNIEYRLPNSIIEIEKPA